MNTQTKKQDGFWIFNAIIRCFKGDDYQLQEKKIEHALDLEEMGRDISPK